MEVIAERFHPPSSGGWCRADNEVMDLWWEHGIPADRSTLEHALRLLFKLHREYRTLLGDA